MNLHETINYLEIPSTNLKLTQKFFEEVFNWAFTSYGKDYLAFKDKTIEGGFFTSTKVMQSKTGSALIIFYSDNLEETYSKVIKARGSIVQEIFNFPGGRRFHFEDVTGNEYAVWSKSG